MYQLLAFLMGVDLWAKAYGYGSVSGQRAFIKPYDIVYDEQDYLITGAFNLDPTNPSYTWDIFLLKLGHSGEYQWFKNYHVIGSDPNNEEGLSLAPFTLPDGKNIYIVCGYDIAGTRIILMAVNVNGDTLWTMGWSPTSGTCPRPKMILSRAGRIVVVSSIRDPDGYADIVLLFVQLTPGGQIESSSARWLQKPYYHEVPFGIAQTRKEPQESFVIAGTYSDNITDEAILLFEVTQDGDPAGPVYVYDLDTINGLYPTSFMDVPHSIAQTGRGFVLTGTSRTDGFFVIEVNSELRNPRIQRFGGGSTYEVYEIIQTDNGDFCLTTGNGLLGLDSLFGVNFAVSLPTHMESATDLIEMPDGSISVVGYSNLSSVIGANDGIVLKVSRKGFYPGCVGPNGYPPLEHQDTSYFISLTPNSYPPPASLNFGYGTLDLTTAQICDPLYEEIGEQNQENQEKLVIVRTLRGGISFFSTYETPISIYASDGRLVHYGVLREGENRIDLDRGVYFWITQAQKGKAMFMR
ncbi:MAG: hypothetical protein ABIM59_05105 [candidate division WOR-3 bacterium]